MMRFIHASAVLEKPAQRAPGVYIRGVTLQCLAVALFRLIILLAHMKHIAKIGQPLGIVRVALQAFVK